MKDFLRTRSGAAPAASRHMPMPSTEREPSFRLLSRSAIKPSDAAKMGTIYHRAVKGSKSGDGEGSLDVTSEWLNYSGRPLLREDTQSVTPG